MIRTLYPDLSFKKAGFVDSAHAIVGLTGDQVTGTYGMYES